VVSVLDPRGRPRCSTKQSGITFIFPNLTGADDEQVPQVTRVPDSKAL